MKARILYGTVQAYNARTRQTETITDVIHVEGTPLEDNRNYILRKKPRTEKDNYKLLKFNDKTAKHVGYTAYDI